MAGAEPLAGVLSFPKLPAEPANATGDGACGTPIDQISLSMRHKAPSMMRMPEPIVHLPTSIVELCSAAASKVGVATAKGGVDGANSGADLTTARARSLVLRAELCHGELFPTQDRALRVTRAHMREVSLIVGGADHASDDCPSSVEPMQRGAHVSLRRWRRAPGTVPRWTSRVCGRGARPPIRAYCRRESRRRRS